MQPSSLLCRTQEARQHALAADASLANVRDVALLAAAAWAKEAASAEKREERMLLKREAADIVAPEDRMFSENPDRGFADCRTS